MLEGSDRNGIQPFENHIVYHLVTLASRFNFLYGNTLVIHAKQANI